MNALLEWLSDSGAAVLVSSLFSVAALVLSVLAYLTSRKALRIEQAREHDRVLAALRAVLKARIMTVGSSDHLLIENTGLAGARDFEVRLDGKLFRDHAVAFE